MSKAQIMRQAWSLYRDTVAVCHLPERGAQSR